MNAFDLWIAKANGFASVEDLLAYLQTGVDARTK